MTKLYFVTQYSLEDDAKSSVLKQAVIHLFVNKFSQPVTIKNNFDIVMKFVKIIVILNIRSKCKVIS